MDRFEVIGASRESRNVKYERSKRVLLDSESAGLSVIPPPPFLLIFRQDDSISLEVMKFQWQLPTTPCQRTCDRNPWDGHIETETQGPLTGEIRELLRANNR